jgi:uncharacterized membrane protein
VSDHRVFGQDRFGRVAEGAARFFGTPQYIVAQTVAAWIALNAVALLGEWDPYPFILLRTLLQANTQLTREIRDHLVR